MAESEQQRPERCAVYSDWNCVCVHTAECVGFGVLLRGGLRYCRKRDDSVDVLEPGAGAGKSCGPVVRQHAERAVEGEFGESAADDRRRRQHCDLPSVHSGLGFGDALGVHTGAQVLVRGKQGQQQGNGAREMPTCIQPTMRPSSSMGSAAS